MADEAIKPAVAPSGSGCVECLATDGWWFHLRRCAACGHIGCCDSSPSQHASKHAQGDGHAIVRSFEPGEDWFWDYTTEQYYDGLQKAGVGIYIDAKPGVAGRELVIDTATPGYNVVIYGRRGLPNPDIWDPGVPGGWFKVGSANDIHATQQIKLDTGGAFYRYYLVWITSLGNHNQVAVNEIALYK